MTLSAIELMDLSDKLDALMSKAATASGMELLDISDEIDQIMQQMGTARPAVVVARKNNLRYMMVCQNWLLISWLINSSIRAPMHLSVPCRI